MVAPLRPGKFYGSSLPRPRIYTETKFSQDRVDPPLPVLDPLLSWANEAHWSMGGLNFKRLRLQGRIEGKVEKLRAQREKLIKDDRNKDSAVHGSDSGTKRAASVSPPPAPVAVKRRRYVASSDEEDSENDDGEGEMLKEIETRGVRRGAARKLGDDFERVATRESGVRGRDSGGVGGDVMKIVQELSDGTEIKAKRINKRLKKGKKGEVQVLTRTSPRLAKRGSN